MKRNFKLGPLLLVGLFLIPGALSHLALGLSGTNSQLVTYQSPGPSFPLGFQRINNTSFETGTQSWTESAYNNYSSSVLIVSPGYNDNSAVQLTITSGNLTVDSHLTLIQDFSKNGIAFENSTRFRAAIQVGQIQGTSATDKVEISVSLTSSTGSTTRLHYAFSHMPSLLANTTSDAYFSVDWSGPTRWITVDRNIATDAFFAFPRLAASFSSVKDARLSVYSTSLGVPNYDPRIKYYETGGDSYWNTTETVVFDPDADGIFNPATDWILLNKGIPPNMQMLSNDPRIKFIDSNLNGQWDPGEPVVYDLKNEGVYDIANNDPVINGTAVAGSLLQHPIRMQTNAILDQVELYSPNGNYDWVHNGGFETGTLTGWGNTAGFIAASNLSHSGTFSALGNAVGTTIDLAQSIDGRPSIDSTTRILASGYIASMTGGLSSDKADVWLGLVDSSPQANPLSIYYYFKTGTGTLPSNTTDTVNHKVAGFGSFSQWLSLNQSLLPETGYFNLTGHTAPYRIEAIALEASAQTGSTTTAYFDDISIPAFYTPAPAVSTYYAADGLNSTYVYTATRVPQGSFYFSIPTGQSVLNITSPASNVLQGSDYATQNVAGAQLITIPLSTSLKYAPLGNWRFYTTSRNALTSVYATSSGSNNPTSNFNSGSSVNFISQSKDPLGNPLSNSNITFLFYSSTTQAFKGRTNNQGWYNQTNIALPQNAGTDILEAITVSSSYIGLRTAQLTINSSFPWAILAYASILGAALVLFSLFYLRSRKKKQAQAATQTTPQ